MLLLSPVFEIERNCEKHIGLTAIYALINLFEQQFVGDDAAANDEGDRQQRRCRERFMVRQIAANTDLCGFSVTIVPPMKADFGKKEKKKEQKLFIKNQPIGRSETTIGIIA